MTTTLSLTEFREAFPEFTEDAFPDTAVQWRLSLAEAFFDSVRWSDSVRPHAIGLYVAHHLALYGSASSGGDGTVAGASSGSVASKGVDGVSVSFDTGSSTYANAGYWNATPYGKELYALLRVFGAGAVQI